MSDIVSLTAKIITFYEQPAPICINHDNTEIAIIKKEIINAYNSQFR
jgi:hypothetical protein